MLSFSGSLRVFVAVEACDMRKGFEGLSALVGTVLNEEVKSGALFAFSNRRRKAKSDGQPLTQRNLARLFSHAYSC
ncbi:MAG TPA: IS66 family insertion sequence element accessory protein TnpB [Terrimicrobiaceae bacterium]